jgi:hypothetical protein
MSDLLVKEIRIERERERERERKVCVCETTPTCSKCVEKREW